MLTAPRSLNRALARLRLVPYTTLMQDTVLKMAREMRDESELHRELPMNEAKLVQQCEVSISRPSRVYLKLCYRNDEALGVFFGLISSPYFSDTLVAKDLAWFVTRSHRGSLAAITLLLDFEQWVREQGVKHICLGQSTGVRMGETQALFTRLGYQTLGSNVLKRI